MESGAYGDRRSPGSGPPTGPRRHAPPANRSQGAPLGVLAPCEPRSALSRSCWSAAARPRRPPALPQRPIRAHRTRQPQASRSKPPSRWRPVRAMATAKRRSTTRIPDCTHLYASMRAEPAARTSSPSSSSTRATLAPTPRRRAPTSSRPGAPAIRWPCSTCSTDPTIRCVVRPVAVPSFGTTGTEVVCSRLTLFPVVRSTPH
jgi:hypothetical protein